MAKKGKKLQDAVKLVDRTQVYSVQEAVELAKKQALLTLTQLLK